MSTQPITSPRLRSLAGRGREPRAARLPGEGHFSAPAVDAARSPRRPSPRPSPRKRGEGVSRGSDPPMPSSAHSYTARYRGGSEVDGKVGVIPRENHHDGRVGKRSPALRTVPLELVPGQGPAERCRKFLQAPHRQNASAFGATTFTAGPNNGFELFPVSGQTTGTESFS